MSAVPSAAGPAMAADATIPGASDMLVRWVRAACTFGCGVLAVAFLTAADVFLAGRELLPLRPIVLFLGFALLLSVLLCLVATSDQSRMRQLVARARDGWSLAIAAVLATGAVSLGASLLASADWDESGTNVFLPALCPLTFFAGLALVVIWPSRRFLGAVLAGALGAMFVSIFWDLVAPGSFSTLVQRAAGLAENANFSSYVVLMLVNASLDWRRAGVRSVLLLGAAAIAVFATLSRSGILMWMLLAAAYLSHDMLRLGSAAKIVRRLGVVAAAAAVVAAVAAVAVQSSEQFNTSTASDRLSAFSGDQAFMDRTDERVLVFRKYVQLTGDRPIAGYGTGYLHREPLGPHNMYLARWVDEGLPGILSYLAMLAVAAWSFARTRDAVGVAHVALMVSVGFFSHELLEQKPFLMMLGVLVGRNAVAGRTNDAPGTGGGE